MCQIPATEHNRSMKHSLLSKICQLSLLVFLFYACSKDTPIPPAPSPVAKDSTSVPVAPPVKKDSTTTPEPPPVKQDSTSTPVEKDTTSTSVPVTTPPAPIEPVKYDYTLKNVASETIVTYNDDSAKPKENYPKVTLSPNQKASIKILSGTGTTPIIHPADSATQTEFTYEPSTKTYLLDAYANEVEIAIAGDVENINIFFTNPVTGLPDSLVNVKLPQTIKYRKVAGEVTVTVEKKQVKGSFTFKTSIKGKLVYSKAVVAPFAKLTTKTRVGDKSTSASLYEPEEWPCGTHNGNRLITGPKGGCYYINKNGNKTYVDRSECSCN